MMMKYEANKTMPKSNTNSNDKSKKEKKGGKKIMKNRFFSTIE